MHTREIHFAVASIRTLTGKNYPALEKALDGVSPEAQQDLVRLVHDLNHAVQAAKREGSLQPWKR